MTPTEVQNRANENYNEIVAKMEKIQKIADELTYGDVDWGHVGSLAHINRVMDDILEGFE